MIKTGITMVVFSLAALAYQYVEYRKHYIHPTLKKL
jgi:hypothetical protein